MSIERPINTPSGIDLSDAEALKALTPDQLEAELAKVLYRGQTQSRLEVPLPPELHGEWVPNDPMEIHRKRTLGFTIDDKYALANALHNDGTGKPVIGDVIFMTCPKQLKEAYDKLESKRYEQTHGKRTKEQRQREEEEYHKLASVPGYIATDPSSTKVISSADVVSGEVITAAKAAATAEAATKQSTNSQLSVNTTGGN